MRWVLPIFGALGSVGLFLTFNRWGRETVTDEVAKISKAVGLTRGFRNNNPGNIRESQGDKTAWVGERSTDDDAAFEEFDTPEAGYRALVRVLDGYRTRYGISTVAGVVARYAPPSENKTGAYAEYVAKALGVSPSKPVDTSDGRTMFRLIDAITRFENGGNPYPDEVLWTGIEMARNRVIST